MLTSERLAIDGGRPVREGQVPLHRPWFDEREQAAARAVLASGRVAGDGVHGRELERLLSAHMGAGVLTVNSCTSALEIAVKIAGLGAGDEVILPSFTFVSTANAVLNGGAQPVFADIGPATFGLDPADVARRITPRTRAILAMHYGGMACDMEALNGIADRHGLVVIEDAAHGLNATWRGQPLGCCSPLGTLSFHETKDLVCGEGGALVIRDHEERMRAAEILREKGTDRTAFLRGDRDKYTWVGTGSSYVLSDLLAAVAVVQFAKLPEITRRKTAQANRLLEALAPYRDVVQLPVVADGCGPNWHVFPVLVAPAQRAWTIQALRAEGLAAAFHYVPLHSAPYGERAAIAAVDLPVTDRVAASLVRLPISADFSPEECEHVVAGCVKVFEHLAAHA